MPKNEKITSKALIKQQQRATNIAMWSFVGIFLYSSIYIGTGATLILGSSTPPAFFSLSFFLISLPILAFSVGIAYGILSRHVVRKSPAGSLVPLSLFTGILVYIAASFLIFLIDSIVIYATRM